MKLADALLCVDCDELVIRHNFREPFEPEECPRCGGIGSLKPLTVRLHGTADVGVSGITADRAARDMALAISRRAAEGRETDIVIHTPSGPMSSREFWGAE